MSGYINEIISGGLGGLTQVILGHPFDTIKVHIQNKVPITNLNLIKLYKGWQYPLPQSIICNSIVFTCNNYLKQYTDNILLCGFISGIVATPPIYFFDIGKTKEQLNFKYTFTDFYKTKGFTSTLIRESCAFSFYFYTYDYFKNKLNCNILLSGSISGVASWAFTYPIDVIRNRQIAHNMSFIDAVNCGNLWKGFNYCIARSIITNAGIFYTYETSKKLFN